MFKVSLSDISVNPRMYMVLMSSFVIFILKLFAVSHLELSQLLLCVVFPSNDSHSLQAFVSRSQQELN